MADIEDEQVGEIPHIDIAEDLGQKSWSVSQTRLLIAHFQQNPILWDKRLKDSANKQKTKKAMARVKKLIIEKREKEKGRSGQ